MTSKNKASSNLLYSIFYSLISFLLILNAGCGSGGDGRGNNLLSITIDPAFATITNEQMMQFKAYRNDTSEYGDASSEGPLAGAEGTRIPLDSSEVTWEADAGFIYPSGLYMAPDSITSSRVISVRAISKKDRTDRGEAGVLLGTEGVLSLSGELSDPEQIVIEPGGKTALVTERGSGEISRVDLASGEVTTVVSGLNHPVGIQINSDGTVAWVVESAPTAIVRINFEDVSSLTRWPIPGFFNVTSLAVKGDGSTAWVTNYVTNASLLQIDLNSDNAVITKLAQFSWPTGVAQKGNGESLFVTEEGSGKLYRINLTACQPAVSYCEKEVITTGLGEPRSPVLSEDGKSAYLIQCQKISNPKLCFDKFLTRIDIGGSTPPYSPSLLIPIGVGNRPMWVALEPGNNTALFTEQRDGGPDAIVRTKIKE